MVTYRERCGGNLSLVMKINTRANTNILFIMKTELSDYNNPSSV